MIIIICQLSARHKIVNVGDIYTCAIDMYNGDLVPRLLHNRYEMRGKLTMPMYIHNYGSLFCQWSDSRQDWVT